MAEDGPGRMILAPHAKIRAQIVPPPVADLPNPPQRRKRAKHWAELLARVFGIDMSACPDCGGPVKIIAPACRQAGLSWSLTRSEQF